MPSELGLLVAGDVVGGAVRKMQRRRQQLEPAEKPVSCRIQDRQVERNVDFEVGSSSPLAAARIRSYPS